MISSRLPSHIHFVGIGGIGMLALAQYVASKGISVSGSDQQDSDNLRLLTAQGARIHVGHAPANIEDAELVVVTSAVSDSNPELVEAARRGIPVVKRARLLGQITAHSKSVAVAGTHGKSTTTALIGHLLRESGIDVTVFGGGMVRDGNGGVEGPFLLGTAPGSVVEADEYDRSFLDLSPTIAVITAVDFDHPDTYANLDDMMEAYVMFARGVSGSLIVSGEAERAVEVARESGVAFETYGMEAAGCSWMAYDCEPRHPGWKFELRSDGLGRGRFTTRLPGRHNVLNSLAALASASQYSGLRPESFRAALATFQGVIRRLEPRGTVNGITIVDDYAHHPAEVSAVLMALNGSARRVRVIFQPHTFTRTQALFAQFVEALSTADEVIVLDVYAAREDPIPGVNSSALAEAVRSRGQAATHFASHDEAVRFVVDTARDGDLIVTMGAGDVGKLPEAILERLSSVQRSTLNVRRSTFDARAPSLEPASQEPQTRLALNGLPGELARAGLTRIRVDEPMSRHTSWRIGGPADIFAVAESPDALRAAILVARDHGVPCLVLGGGSNVLASDQGIEGLVILNRIHHLRLQRAGGSTHIDAGSGVFFARLAIFSVRHGLAGLEWGIAIPGTIGAGVVNNAGAHNGDVQRTLVRAEAVDSSGRVLELEPKQLQFNYRQSQLKRTDGSPICSTETVITRCWFTAQPDRAGRAAGLIEELMARRRATQPISEPSAGSTFKNPESGSAGAFIERAGLKGIEAGGAQFSTKHANFIVNNGGATAADVVRLIHLARNRVRESFGVELEPEVQVVGRWSEAYPLLDQPSLPGFHPGECPGAAV